MPAVSCGLMPTPSASAREALGASLGWGQRCGGPLVMIALVASFCLNCDRLAGGRQSGELAVHEAVHGSTSSAAYLMTAVKGAPSGTFILGAAGVGRTRWWLRGAGRRRARAYTR